MQGKDKREARRAAARLLALGKVSVSPRSQEERFAELRQDLRNQDVYEAAEACADCDAARKKNKDATALCDRHLAQAMGA